MTLRQMFVVILLFFVVIVVCYLMFYICSLQWFDVCFCFWLFLLLFVVCLCVIFLFVGCNIHLLYIGINYHKSDTCDRSSHDALV